MTEDEIQQTANLLKKFEPGFLPYPVFEQIMRIMAMPIVEFIPLRKVADHIEVLLLARPDDDPFWPGMLHTPGTVVRATDFNGDAKDAVWPAFSRILHDELQNTQLGTPLFVGSILHKSKRGVEQAQLYAVEVQGEPQVGTFYSVDNLPTSLIDSQLKFIAEAARLFSQVA